MIFLNIVGSTDQASPQQPQVWFSEHIFAPKPAVLFVMPIVSATARKKSEKPHSIRLLR